VLNRAVPTIQDVARVANVSTATVSRALSYPERVSKETRRIVIEAIERTGYTVNQTARSLRRRQSGAIVVLVPNIGNPFFSQVIAGIEATASQAGLNVLIADTRAPHAAAAHIGEYLHNNRADGLIVLDGSLPPEILAGTGPRTPPVVFCCEWNEDSNLPSVRFDNFGGAGLAIDHLHALGHRKIGHILGPQNNVLTRERARGVSAALARHGLDERRDWLFAGDFSLAAGRRAAERWLAMSDRPTAVTASSDVMACGFISGLHRAGIRVPADVSVVGFDDIDIAEQFIPALTTVNQPRIDMGGRATARLIGLIGKDEAGGLPLVQTVEAELIVRESTQPLR
jgi:LacI family repressor for deo operon, udp, cdd, tsx, nupC, and nupG